MADRTGLPLRLLASCRLASHSGAVPEPVPGDGFSTADWVVGISPLGTGGSHTGDSISRLRTKPSRSLFPHNNRYRRCPLYLFHPLSPLGVLPFPVWLAAGCYGT